MKHLRDVRNQYHDGDLTKPDYIESMYRMHGMLFEYASYLADTDIAGIEITDNDVILTTRSSGLRFSCKPGDRRLPPLEALNFGAYEKTELDFLQRLIGDGAVVYDIGANIGWHTLAFAKAHPTATVHAFEPIPDTFAYLTKNIRLNGLGNAAAHNFGLSDSDRDLEFFYYPEGSGNASSANLSQSRHVRKLTCTVKAMDTLPASFPDHVDFIKCDVEGAELFVYRGGVKTISRDNPIIFSEILRKWTAKLGYNPNDIIALLSSLGYAAFTIDGEMLRKFTAMDETTKETNFLFLHTEKHEETIRTYVR